FDRIDVRSFQVALVDLAKAGVAGDASDRLPGGGRLAIEIVAERAETGVIGEVDQGELTEKLRRWLAGGARIDFAGLVDEDVERVLREGDRRVDGVAVAGHQLAGGGFVERAGAGIERLTARADDLKPAAAVDGEIEGVGGLRERPLDVQVADADGADAEA